MSALLRRLPNHTFNFKDLYLANKNTNQLRKFSVFCWDVDDQPIFLWNVLTKVNKQKKSKIILRFLVKSHNKCLLFFPTTTSGCCGWSCCARGPGRYGTENSFIEEGEGGLNSSCSHRRRIPRYSCGQFAWHTLLWIVFRQIFRNK